MGGTHVTHHYGYVTAELMRYKMDRDLVVVHQGGYEKNYFTMNVEGMIPWGEGEKIIML